MAPDVGAIVLGKEKERKRIAAAIATTTVATAAAADAVPRSNFLVAASGTLPTSPHFLPSCLCSLEGTTGPPFLAFPPPSLHVPVKNAPRQSDGRNARAFQQVSFLEKYA